MISGLRGRVAEAGRGFLVVEVGGVGLEVQVPTSLVAPAAGKEIALCTHLIVREDGLTLYGFSSREERDLFRFLLGVTGVGPRVALAVVSGCAPGRFWEAVRQGDVGLLTGIAGVGKKTAQRLVMELRDKAPPAAEGQAAVSSVRQEEPDQVQEAAREALIALGYASREAAEAVEAVVGSNPAEAASAGSYPWDADQIILAALRWLARTT